MAHNIPMDLRMARSLLEFKKRDDEFEENVIENILSRIPFPYIFKTCILSRHWFSKFHLAARFRTSFHEKIIRFSHTWRSYCPAFVRIVKEPSSIVPTPTGKVRDSSFKQSESQEIKILIVNWLTGCWRHMLTPELLGAPGSGLSCGGDWDVLILPFGPSSYKLVVNNIVIEANDQCNLVYLSDHIYDSQTKMWINPRTPVSNSMAECFHLSPYSACLGNLLFRLWIPLEATRIETKNSIIIMETDVVQGVSFETIFPGQRRKPTLFGGLFHCASAVYMVLTEAQDQGPGSSVCEPPPKGRRARDPPLDLDYIRSKLAAANPSFEDARAGLAAISSANAVRAQIFIYRPDISEVFPISESPPHITLYKETTMAADGESIFFIGPRVQGHEVSGSKIITRRFLSSFRVDDPQGGWSIHPPFPELRRPSSPEGPNFTRWERFFSFHPGQNPFVMP
ncbi:hypothetical protein AXG93_3522s1160 [Marchantia polymorpha subsp. ruderalis]|uniref:F-box domain-containing protein n=1 Tax=Marchantia polymorpha subsp. ruderalis TaxID=1480154 RepID=A0A176WF86_MARPO|nr:hypothetical protein AXG93_3522s1160 [Marchantia polymorpha subsp. ruderalis]